MFLHTENPFYIETNGVKQMYYADFNYEENRIDIYTPDDIETPAYIFRCDKCDILNFNFEKDVHYELKYDIDRYYNESWEGEDYRYIDIKPDMVADFCKKYRKYWKPFSYTG